MKDTLKMSMARWKDRENGLGLMGINMQSGVIFISV